MEGKVIVVHDVDNDTCGKYVEVQHQYNITSLYCHMSQPEATVGDEVKPGDIIGLTGQTGAATGPHVHFQVMVYGIAVNPRIFMVGDPEPY
jgi:murein DD-endopeptidase MepM/ murein hydrolase activator NlpD